MERCNFKESCAYRGFVGDCDNVCTRMIQESKNIVEDVSFIPPCERSREKDGRE